MPPMGRRTGSRLKANELWYEKLIIEGAEFIG
jgi:hypothetical protein